MPYTLFNSSTVWEQKLASIPYLRGDMVFTLNVNASRFTQGRYILYFLPCPGPGNIDTINKYWYNCHAIDNMQRTQLPHVEIDLATQTSAQLIVPYLNIKTYYNTKPMADLSSLSGSLGLIAYSPMQPGSGPASVPFTLWANFENIELNGTFVQSGINVRRRGKDGKDIITAENEGAFRPVSGILNAVSAFSNTLSGVPLLSPYTAPLSWATSILARTAESFGFSKTQLGSPMNRVSRRVNPYGANADGQNDSCSLAISKNNYVKTTNGASDTEVDEMSIDFIKSQFAFCVSVDFPTSLASGDSLGFITHCPYNQTHGATGGTLVQAPVAFLSRLFTYWRGSMIIRIKFVKTEFHSGRILVAYCPDDPDNGAVASSMSLSKTMTLHRTIIDIRETSEFEVCLPYVTPSVYLHRQQSAGSLYLYVLDPLVAPTSVANNIKMLVEVAGGPDMEFAVPVGTSHVTALPAVNVQSGYNVYPCQDYDTNPDSLSPAMTSIGERVTSLRQLIKRMGLTGNRIALATLSGNDIYIYPFLHNTAVQSNTDANVFRQGTYSQDLLSYISSCYAFNSGSVHINLFLESGSNPLNKDFLGSLVTSETAIEAIPNDIIVTGGAANVYRRSPASVASKDIEGYMSFHIPAYNRQIVRSMPSSFVSLESAGWSNSAALSQKGANSLALVVRRANITAVTNTDLFSYTRTAGDDYNCTKWVSTPTCKTF